MVLLAAAVIYTQAPSRPASPPRTPSNQKRPRRGGGSSSRSGKLGVVEKDCEGSRHHTAPYNDPVAGIWPWEGSCTFPPGQLGWQSNPELTFSVLVASSLRVAVSSQLTTSCGKCWQETKRQCFNQYQHKALAEEHRERQGEGKGPRQSERKPQLP